MKRSKPTIYTIGHSNRPIDEFVALLVRNTVELVVDIRKMPKSRHNPQFEGDALDRALKEAGIGYRHEPLLGGLRRAQKDSVNDGWKNASFRGFADYMATEDFQSGLNELTGAAARRTTAIMCAEAVPWRCHRSLVADALKAAGFRVFHIVGRGKPSEHRYTRFLRRRRGVLTYPASALNAG
ncbi:MAG TPA: DUF488 domain-containing protein [Vicinamibacterales bacterium]|nr:DUF488 domain-containing protein [Vicinamibacterales bacterium]